MKTRWNEKGMSLIEVLIAAMILVVGIAGILTAFPAAYTNVVTSGEESKATAFAQEKIEELKNLPFSAGPFDNSGNPEVPEPGYTRSWTITQEAGTIVPNRLARIAVTVSWGETQTQSLTLETMRLEWSSGGGGGGGDPTGSIYVFTDKDSNILTRAFTKQVAPGALAELDIKLASDVPGAEAPYQCQPDCYAYDPNGGDPTSIPATDLGYVGNLDASNYGSGTKLENLTLE